MVIIKNDGKQLTEALGLDPGSLRHVGGFTFEATQDGKPITIYTEPVDDEAEKIKIQEVKQ